VQWCFCVSVCVCVRVYLCISSPTSCLSEMCVSYYLPVRHYCGVWNCPPDSPSETVTSRCVCVFTSLTRSESAMASAMGTKIIQLLGTSSARSSDSVRVQLRMNHGLVLFKNDLCQERMSS